MLQRFFDELLDAIDYPEFRRERTSVMFRRMMGRAMPSKWEFHTIMGVFGDATKIIRGR
jgi:tRNA C32,U32 (ribose-2'-O)-methylase TrmJ